MATAKDVQTALRQLLPTLDINTTTERLIRERLAQQLGPVDEHKKLIKQEVDEFLTQSLENDVAGPAQDRDDDFEAATAAGSKRGRAAPAGAAPAAAKRSKENRAVSPAGQQQEEKLPGIQLDTQGLKYASISLFKGAARVDLRNYFRNKERQLGPTKKGVSFSAADWSALQGLLPKLTAAVQAGSTDFSLDLGLRNIKLQTTVFLGEPQAAIREFYSDANGELKPSHKGISLTPDQYDVLIASLPELNKQLAAAGGGGAAAPAARGAGAGAAPTAAAPAAAARKAAAGGTKGGSDDEFMVDLGNKKRAAISMFTGKPTVDLREMYEKDGKMAPGKKGISLRPEQWAKIVAAAGDISAAHTARDESYRLELTSNRQVSISSFKGVCYVNVREMYQKDGEWRPTQKGLSMNADQWKKLAAGMEELSARLA